MHHCADDASFTQPHPFKRLTAFFGVRTCWPIAVATCCVSRRGVSHHICRSFKARRQGVEISKDYPGKLDSDGHSFWDTPWFLTNRYQNEWYLKGNRFSFQPIMFGSYSSNLRGCIHLKVELEPKLCNFRMIYQPHWDEISSQSHQGN